MDTQIQQSAGPSSFIKAGGSNPAPALSWFDEHRSVIVKASIAAVVLIAVVVAMGSYMSSASAKAEGAFSNAMDVYDTPLRQPGQPVDPGTPAYNTAAERAKAANPLFEQAADQYGFFQAGVNARYFAGLTAQAMGQTAQAEADLKKASQAREAGVSSLAKLALASFYRQTSRQQQAIDLYQQLIAKPTLTVPVSTARLQLAEIYEATKPDEARRLYAQIKDSDKTSAAAQIAAQKLDGKK